LRIDPMHRCRFSRSFSSWCGSNRSEHGRRHRTVFVGDPSEHCQHRLSLARGVGDLSRQVRKVANFRGCGMHIFMGAKDCGARPGGVAAGRLVRFGAASEGFEDGSPVVLSLLGILTNGERGIVGLSRSFQRGRRCKTATEKIRRRATDRDPVHC